MLGKLKLCVKINLLLVIGCGCVIKSLRSFKVNLFNKMLKKNYIFKVMCFWNLNYKLMSKVIGVVSLFCVNYVLKNMKESYAFFWMGVGLWIKFIKNKFNCCIYFFWKVILFIMMLNKIKKMIFIILSVLVVFFFFMFIVLLNII